MTQNDWKAVSNTKCITGQHVPDPGSASITLDVASAAADRGYIARFIDDHGRSHAWVTDANGVGRFFLPSGADAMLVNPNG